MIAVVEVATILVVEDDPGIAELEKDRLREAGHEVLVAGTADEALALLHGNWVDLILLDYRLPGAENGLDFYARVKGAGFDVPVILVTGFGSEATVIQALRTGVRDFVTKSVEYLDYLPEAVGRVLRQVQTEHRLAESEARLAGVIGSAKDAVIVTEADRRVSLFNPAAERLFGRTAAEALGRPITDFIPDELASSMADPDDPNSSTPSQRLRTGTRGIRADGSEFPLEASVSRGQANGRRFYTVVVRDVSERMKAEAALRESEERFRAFMDNPLVLAWMKDEAGRYVYLSRPYQARFGLRPEVWQGKTDFDLWPAETAEQFRDHDETVIHESRPIEVVETTPAPGGGRTSWWSFKFLFRDVAGRRYVGGIGVDVTSKERAEEQLREQAALLDLAHDAIKVTDLGGHVRYWNRGAERLYGWTAEEAVGRPVEELLYRGRSDVWRETLRQVLADGEWTGELRMVVRSGKEILAHCSWSLLRNPEGEPTGVFMICTDVTQRGQLEQQLRQAQKMEVVGQLAGGVAHDFNNLLTVINGFSDLVLDTLPVSDRARGMITEVRKAGERASGLTRQLLTLSRQQVLEPKVMDVNVVVREATNMLRRLIGEDFELRTTLAPGLWPIKADPGQVEQVLMNLVVNARDAMPRGGRLTVETSNAELDNESGRAGRYVVLKVADTGHGMTDEVKARIFDPFFTTKEVGRGTGLGLATVSGIVTQAGGHIELKSEVGRGTTFAVYLPVTSEAAAGSRIDSALRAPARGSETVLLAEDDAALRTFVHGVLTSAGYTVLEAGDGPAALSLCERSTESIDLLVTDVVMPGLGGRQLAEQVAALRPGVKVLYLSGYTPDAVVRHGVEQAAVAFLQKPFSPAVLTRKVREVLDGAR